MAYVSGRTIYHTEDQDGEEFAEDLMDHTSTRICPRCKGQAQYRAWEEVEGGAVNRYYRITHAACGFEEEDMLVDRRTPISQTEEQGAGDAAVQLPDGCFPTVCPRCGGVAVTEESMEFDGAEVRWYYYISHTTCGFWEQGERDDGPT